MNIQKIKEAADFAKSNERQLADSKLAGCFYCMEIFPATEVVEFLKQERSALCPKCTTDSVLGDASGYEITKDNLVELHRYWFGSPTSPKVSSNPR